MQLGKNPMFLLLDKLFACNNLHLSQLQNSSTRKIALLSRVATELPRLPSSGRPPSARRKGYAFPSQPGLKSSILRCRGVLPLAHFIWTSTPCAIRESDNKTPLRAQTAL